MKRIYNKPGENYGKPDPRGQRDPVDLAKQTAAMEMMESMPLWQCELVHEYGNDAFTVVRTHPTPAAARVECERLRQQKEFARWRS